MNLRQKAKHFKKLYEEGLPKKPYPVIHTANDLKHYKAQYIINERDLVQMQQQSVLYETEMVNSMLRQLKPIVRSNIKAEKDLYTDKVIYSLDIWM
jgi:hypothetical protein